MRSDLMNAEISAQYLEMILEANPDAPIILLWDRAPWHRGKPIDKVLEEILVWRSFSFQPPAQI